MGLTPRTWLGGFHHGVHPHHHKESTEDQRIRRMPFTRRYVLPLSQHIGAPARAIVGVGQRVERGERIADPGGFVSTALHAPVTGTVSSLAPRRHPSGSITAAIEIEADPWSDQRVRERPPVDWRTLSDEEFLAQVQRGAGLVGMGGAAFPSHVKYAVPADRLIEHLVVNGAECEPFLTCDHRLMVERPHAVAGGIRIAAHRLGVRDAVVGIERNKPDAVHAMQGVLDDQDAIRVVPLAVKYPQGAEKMLIRALFRTEVPAGKLPLDVGMVVNNVGTMAALHEYFDSGKPLIERVVTVAGPAIREPANLLVPIGTPVREVVEAAGGLTSEARLVVMGGPMMGQPLPSLDVPVLKGTSGVLAFTEEAAGLPEEHSCIRCGRCLEACAAFLDPQRLARLARAGRFEDMESAYVFDCMECGACSFACPSGIPIVQLIRVAKARLRQGEGAS